MNRDELEMKEAMQTQYDLKSLKVRRLGTARNSFGGIIVRLEPDVARMFPNADAVNEALRFLLRAIQDNQALAPTAQTNILLEQKDESS